MGIIDENGKRTFSGKTANDPATGVKNTDITPAVGQWEKCGNEKSSARNETFLTVGDVFSLDGAF